MDDAGFSSSPRLRCGEKVLRIIIFASRAPIPAFPRYTGEGEVRCSASVLVTLDLDDVPPPQPSPAAQGREQSPTKCCHAYQRV